MGLSRAPVVDCFYDLGSRMLQRTTNCKRDGWDLLQDEKDIWLANNLSPHLKPSLSPMPGHPAIPCGPPGGVYGLNLGTGELRCTVVYSQAQPKL